MKVFFNHTQVGTFPDTATAAINSSDGSFSVMVGPSVSKFNNGQWHAAGNMVCAFIVPDPNCPNCHRPAPTANSVPQSNSTVKLTPFTL